ncbi:hypothetical protein B0H10DRAFT_2439762 [Mycena sp. CBHHK59/15]|nr:hypothetical protein B0H10DRAFT_2439762 [Mycena sp. CBHHK59/15]
MSHRSLLFTSNVDLQSMQFLDSCATPQRKEHAYQVAQSDGWWNFATPATRANTRADLHDQAESISCNPSFQPADVSVHSSYASSPHVHSELLPFSPSFSPAQLNSGLQPEFIFPPTRSLARSHGDWRGTFDPAEMYEHPSIPSSPGWTSMYTLPIQPFDDAYPWNEMFLSALESKAGLPFAPYQLPSPLPLRHTFPCPSPSPSLSSSGRLSPLSSFASTPSTSRRSSVDTNAKKHCSHCQATSTPLWRRDPATQLPLCNACGLYLQQRNKMRPPALIAADREDDEPDAPLAPDAPECSHCHTRRTSVWRRSKSGAKLCNACGVYARLRGRDRPLSLKRNKIKPRCKHPKVK